MTKLKPMGIATDSKVVMKPAELAKKIQDYSDQQLKSILDELHYWRQFGSAKTDGAKNEICKYVEKVIAARLKNPEEVVNLWELVEHQDQWLTILSEINYEAINLSRAAVLSEFPDMLLSLLENMKIVTGVLASVPPAAPVQFPPGMPKQLVVPKDATVEFIPFGENAKQVINALKRSYTMASKYKDASLKKDIRDALDKIDTKE